MFKLMKPCHDCPFRVEGGIRLRAARAREIAKSQIQSQGGTFECHKTVEHDDDGEHLPRRTDQYCAGAIAFAMNVGAFNQFLRIALRMRWLDLAAMKDRDQVFSSVSEMVAAQGKRVRESA